MEHLSSHIANSHFQFWKGYRAHACASCRVLPLHWRTQPGPQRPLHCAGVRVPTNRKTLKIYLNFCFFMDVSAFVKIIAWMRKMTHINKSSKREKKFEVFPSKNSWTFYSLITLRKFQANTR